MDLGKFATAKSDLKNTQGNDAIND